MSSLELRILGCGDAFGSGGRLNTSFHFASSNASFLIDCGATAMSAMKRFGIDPGSIDFVVVTHLHGDHFAGLAFLIRETQIVVPRSRPLTIVGPSGLEARVRNTMELLFPGSAATQSFPLNFVEYSSGTHTVVGALDIEAFPVLHTPGTEPHAVRVRFDEVVVAYSGDTEWTEALVDASRDADLFICEAYTYQRSLKNHLSFARLMAERHKLGCRQLMLTHLGDEMLASLDRIPTETIWVAEDGARYIVSSTRE